MSSGYYVQEEGFTCADNKYESSLGSGLPKNYMRRRETQSHVSGRVKGRCIRPAAMLQIRINPSFSSGCRSFSHVP